MRLLTEKSTLNANVKIDRTGPRPTLRNVLLCGFESANRRRYRREAFRDAVSKYEGRPVFLNHGRGERGYESRVGTVQNVSLRKDGAPVADVVLNGAHPFVPAILDDAEFDPRAVGMSHVAYCTSKTAADGWEEVSSIDQVESVDLVLQPATTKGLWESISNTRKGTNSMTTIRKLCERIQKFGTAPQRHAATRLREVAGAVLDAPADDAATPANGLLSAFMSAGAHLLKSALTGGMEAGAALTKLRRLIATYRDTADDDTDAGVDDDGLDDSGLPLDMASALESRSFADIVQGRPSKARVKRFVAEVRDGRGFEFDRGPVAAVREARRGAPKPVRQQPGTVPTCPKAFAASIRD